jgi:hypothetical protein
MRYNKSFAIFQLICLFSFMVTTNSLPVAPSEKATKTSSTSSLSSTLTVASTTTSQASTPLPTAAIANFTNPSNLPTAVTGQITFIKIPQNKTNVKGRLDSGIFDKIATNYQFKVVDRSKKLLYDLTANGLTNWSVVGTGTSSFQHDFDKLSISKIVNQFFVISHHKKGTVGMTIIKAI